MQTIAEDPPHPLRVAVVIATHNREAELANRALRSVLAQSRLPDLLVVVDDSHRRHRDANRRIVCGVKPPAGKSMTVKYLQNDRTPGLSGALNVGLDWLHRQVEDCDRTLVAILDDDDSIDPRYLDACVRLQAKGDFDLVAADIMRIEGAGKPPSHQPAPDALRVEDFLVSNPGIQGSNIFARLGTLLAAGLFDEALPSTTDRDLCIRLADLGFVRYARLAVPLVHHYADADRLRLSTPGSAQKRAGLDAFYRKYHRRMTEEQLEAFLDRGQRLFDWAPPSEPESVSRKVENPPTKDAAPLSLIIGMTTQSDPSPALVALLEDLVALRGDSRLASFDIVLLENGPRSVDGGHSLVQVAEGLREKGIGSLLVPLERQAQDASSGLFGQGFQRGMERASIALARTMLQTYVYLWAKQRPSAVVWIMDDDMRLDNLVWDGGTTVERRPLDVVGLLDRLRRTDVDIALGTCTEAPPLPFASCMRTQLVDAWHSFEVLAAMRPGDPFPDLLPENMATRGQFNDYYYDLSRRETDQLETPFWYVPLKPGQPAVDVLAEMVTRLPRVLAGEEVFRPLVIDGAVDPLDHVQPSVHRGGNAFMFDLEALWDFPNGVPSIAGGDTRRSDMVWSLLNRYGARRKVVKLPLPVRQDRSDVPVQALDLEKLARDIHGYAIYSALDDLLLQRCEDSHESGTGHLPDPLEFTEEEVRFAVSRVQKYTAERLYAFQLSFYRAAGLSRSLGRYLDPCMDWWWLREPRCSAVLSQLCSTVERLRAEYDLARLKPFRQKVLAVDGTVVRAWLDALRTEIQARKTRHLSTAGVSAWLVAERSRDVVDRVRALFGTGELRVLGLGSEGVVLTDGTAVFKCFDTGRLSGAELELARQAVGRWAVYHTLYNIRKLGFAGPMPVLVYDFETSTPYAGGRGLEMRLLLEECRDAGIILTNVHPENLVVTSSGALKFIDYGCDIEPFTEEDWMLMARRVWLSAKHPRHPDLKSLMRRSLTDGQLPELEGIDAFLAVDPRSTKESLLDERLKRMVLRTSPGTVLDYGCGRARLADSLVASGVDVTGYDPDPGLKDWWAQRSPGLCLHDRTALSSLLERGPAFDVVVCSLVVCVIEDEAELARAIEDMSRLTRKDGRLLVAICNPAHVARSTHLQHREPPSTVDEKCITWKTVRSSGARRQDIHRPLPAVLEAFASEGFHLVHSEPTASFDPDTLDPSSDFLILEFQRERDRRPS